MGCQCNNQKDEDLSDELINKNSLEEGNEEEPDQDNNNNDQKEGIFGLTNQEEIEQNQNQNQDQQNQLRSSNNEENNPNNLNNFNNGEEQADIGYSEKKYEEEKNKKYSNYPEKMLELIKKIREDTVSYAEVIDDSIQNIIEEQNDEDENKTKLIYKKKVKVALTRGEPAFREVAEKLRNMSSLPPLEFKNDICIPLPESKEELREPKFLKEHVNALRQNTRIDVFFKDLVKIPDVSALLMVVDDSPKNPGKKRQAVLSKDFKYIGINSKFIGKTFIAYFTFSK